MSVLSMFDFDGSLFTLWTYVTGLDDLDGYVRQIMKVGGRNHLGMNVLNLFALMQNVEHS